MPPKRKKGLKGGKTASELLLEEKRKVFIPPVWTSSRPKPRINDDAWPAETAEMLARYMDWHGRHPHMVSPRASAEILRDTGQKIVRDDDDPSLVYFPTATTTPALPADFTPSVLGADGNFEDASIVAAVYERQANLAGGRDSDDPWYTMSVKDRLEQFHIDGDHTTQKSKPRRPPPKTEAQLAFEKEELWQKEQYGGYGGGGPAFEGDKRKILEALTLANPTAKETKKKIGPWESEYVFTKYTKDGTNLLEFNQIEMEKRVNNALTVFRAMSASASQNAKKAQKSQKSKGLKNAMGSMAALFSSGNAPISPELVGSEANHQAVDGSPNGDQSEVSGNMQNESLDVDETADDVSILTAEGVDGMESVAGVDGEMKAADSILSSSLTDQTENGTGGRKKRKKKGKLDFVDELQLSMEKIVEEGEAEVVTDPSKPDPDAQLGKYELMIKKFGGEELCEKKAEEWIKFAAYVRKKAKREQNMFDTTTDIFDACNQGNLVKVLYILGVQGVDPNTKTPDDEPLIIHMINKLILLDNMSDSLHDATDESPERRKVFRVVQALIKFGVDIKTLEGKGGQGAIHLATSAGNSKIVQFLIENGCSGTQWDKTLDPTCPIMIAAKLGYVQVIAVLLRKGVPIGIKDEHGRTALHWAGYFGQTRTALFLLQCGSDKRIMDKKGKSPGVLAEEIGYIVTGQAILTYTVPAFQSMTVLNYYANRIEKADAEAKAREGGLIGNFSKLLAAEHGAGVSKLGDSFMGFVGSIITSVVGLGRRVLGIRAKVDKPSDLSDSTTF